MKKIAAIAVAVVFACGCAGVQTSDSISQGMPIKGLSWGMQMSDTARVTSGMGLKDAPETAAVAASNIVKAAGMDDKIVCDCPADPVLEKPCTLILGFNEGKLTAVIYMLPGGANRDRGKV